MQKRSSLRIIGGKWRSRKIDFLPLETVRPTTNPIRETVFNWLAPIIADANCLDLFAGSGALGFEALSRGAKSVLFIDKSIKIISLLKENARALNAKNADFLCALIPRDLLKIPKQTFDIVFLDPPFKQNLLQTCCELLRENNYIGQGSYIYLEAEKSLNIQEVIPKDWQIVKSKITGEVGYYLITI
ncbi:MAG: 16S rRNA (guanine(966)-N(2))-methyltransferase RsmD [Gammaproteobacteria bacterium]|nr:16S rRNA (guanine(966)-N(2))-methyltransferase RsmD [Gammaproteobacteria bacterium]